MFSQIDPPVGLAAWLACASFVLMLVNQVMRLKERLLGERRAQELFPQPLEVRAAPQPVSREYCDRNHHVTGLRLHAVEQDLAGLRAERMELAAKFDEKFETVSREIPEMERRLNAMNEARFEKVHSRINEVLGEVRELRGQVNQL